MDVATWAVITIVSLTTLVSERVDISVSTTVLVANGVVTLTAVSVEKAVAVRVLCHNLATAFGLYRHNLHGGGSDGHKQI